MQKAFFMVLLAPVAVFAQQVVTQPEVVEATKNLSNPQQVYVVQQAPAPQPAAPQVVVRQQPVTVVEDTPLKESKAEALRRSRMEVETETEQKIVEKLESERMKAERERSEKIAKALEGKQEEEKKPEPAPAPLLVQPAPMQPVQQSPQVVNVVEAQPVVATSSSDLDKPEEKPEEKPRVYVTGMGGIADYPGVKNIRGIYAAGFGVGIQFPERLIVEGSFLMSSYDIEKVDPYYGPNPYYPNIKQIDQTNFLGAVKYQILDGRIRPVGGLLAGYTRRVYSDKQYSGYQAQEITSQAFDMGVSGGVDVELAKNFAVGMDLRYMFNMSYRVDGQYQTSMYSQQAGKPVESLDYYILTFGGRLMF